MLVQSYALTACQKYVLILFNYFYFRYSYIHFNLYLYVSTVGSSVKWCNVTVVGIGKAGSDTTRTKLISSSVFIDSSSYEYSKKSYVYKASYLELGFLEYHTAAISNTTLPSI